MTHVVAEPMPPASNRQQLLSCAKASPEIAAAHDKAGWLDLYVDGAVVEDPVGSPASHKGRRPGRYGDELGRFYEAFISASAIEIRSVKDLVSGPHVFRAVHIHTTNLRTGLHMRIPANLLYTLVFEDGRPKISSMKAHWEVNRMSRQIMGEGLKGAATIAFMNYKMLRAFGPKWLADYFRSSQQGIGRRGKDAITQLGDSLHSRQSRALFDGAALVELPGGRKTSPQPFLEGCTFLHPGDLLASGWTVSGLARVEWGGREQDAALVAEFDPASSAITRLRLFWEH